MTPGKDSLTEITLFSLEQQGGGGQEAVARRLSSLEDAVRTLGRKGFTGNDDYGFYL